MSLEQYLLTESQMHGFFKAILADRTDLTTHFIFADWLQENDRPGLAEFLRSAASLYDDNVPRKQREAIDIGRKYTDARNELAARGVWFSVNYARVGAALLSVRLNTVVGKFSPGDPVELVNPDDLTREEVEGLVFLIANRLRWNYWTSPLPGLAGYLYGRANTLVELISRELLRIQQQGGDDLGEAVRHRIAELNEILCTPQGPQVFGALDGDEIDLLIFRLNSSDLPVAKTLVLTLNALRRTG